MDAVEDIAGKLSRANYKECIKWVESQKNNNKRCHECDDSQNKNIYERYEELLDYNDVQDLSGIIINCVSLLNFFDDEYDSGIEHLLVDEYQDINHTDYALIKHLSKDTESVFFVGDDDQSIYGWRGADPQILHDFERDYDEAIIETIEESRRCTEEILNGAIEIVKKCKIYHPKKLISVKGKGEKINLLTSRNHETEAEWVSNKIIDLNKNQGLELSDISILTKQLNRANEIHKSMLKKGIKVNYWRPNQIFRDPNIRKIFAVMRVLSDRSDNLALRLCLKNIKNYGIGKKGINIIRKIEEDLKTTPWDILRNQNKIKECGKWGSKYDKFADMIDNYETAIADKTPEECIQLISKIFVTKNTPNIDQLIEFSRPLHELKLADFIQEFNNQRGLELTDENAPTTPDENAVNIMSLHASKGLGFKAVFVVGLEETFFPNPSQDNDEQRRLCYVAMTRAKEQVFMCYSTNIVGPSAFGAQVYRPSEYMTDISEEYRIIIQN